MPKIVQYNLPPGGTVIQVADNQVALNIESTDAKDYITIDTTDGAEVLNLGKGGAKIGIGTSAVSITEVLRVRQSHTSDELVLLENSGAGIALTCQSGTTSSGVNVVQVKNSNGTIFAVNAAGTTQTIGAFATTGGGTVGTGGSSDATLTLSGATTFESALHVGAAIKIVDSGDGEVFLRTVASITSTTVLEMDEAATIQNSSAWYHDSGELFAVKTGDSKSLFSVNETGAIGCGSAAGTAHASNNIAIGDDDSLDAITTGVSNVIVGGSNATHQLTTGSRNVIMGYRAGEDSTDTSDSVIIGEIAGAVGVAGDKQVLIGRGAGTSSTDDNNVAIGYQAMYDCSGSDNVAIGSNALDATGDSDSCVAIGKNSLTAATGDYNVGVGAASLFSTVGGSGNVAIGYSSGSVITTGTSCVMLGREAQPSANDGDNQVVIGKSAAGQGDDTVMLGNSSVDTTNGLFCYDTGIASPSDARIKDNVEDSNLGLDFIKALRPVSYQKKHPSEFPEEIREARWANQTLTETNEDGEDVDIVRPADTKPDDWQPKTEYGLVAQEVKGLIDSIAPGFHGHSVTAHGVETVKYVSFIAPLIKAVQELTARVAELEAGD